MNVPLHDMPRFVVEHHWTRRRLSEYLDGELPDAHAHRVERHASRCPRCDRLLASLKRTVVALRALDRPASGDVADRVIARLRSER